MLEGVCLLLLPGLTEAQTGKWEGALKVPPSVGT